MFCNIWNLYSNKSAIHPGRTVRITIITTTITITNAAYKSTNSHNIRWIFCWMNARTSVKSYKLAFSFLLLFVLFVRCSSVTNESCVCVSFRYIQFSLFIQRRWRWRIVLIKVFRMTFETKNLLFLQYSKRTASTDYWYCTCD